MRRSITRVVCGILMATMVSNVSAEQEGDFIYSIGNGEATITGYTGDGGNVVIPDTLGGLPVVTIGISAFENNNDLQTVKLSKNLKQIHSFAFRNCTSLSAVNFNNAQVELIKAFVFSNCTALQNISLPASLTQLDGSSFGSSGLTSLEFPAGITRIDTSTCSGCKNLERVVLGRNLLTLGDSAFSGCIKLSEINLPDGLQHIGHSTFHGNFELNELVIPGSVTNIGPYAFSSCTGLYSIVLPAGLTTINAFTFDNCKLLNGVELPAGITTIGERAFSVCSKLSAIILPAALQSVGKGAFRSNASLYGVYFMGAAPVLDIEILQGSPNAAFYYIPGKPGWPANSGFTEYPWRVNLIFDGQGGEPAETTLTLNVAQTIDTLPVVVHPGHTFQGWWSGIDGRGELFEADIMPYATEDIRLYALWHQIPKVGMAFSMSLPVAFQGVAGVRVAKLPPGIRLNAKNGRLEGVPTKAGTYIATISAKGVPPQTMEFMVEPMPLWAQGKFDGVVRLVAGIPDIVALASMSVGKNGKISGKVRLAGENITFKAPSFDRVDDCGNLIATVMAKIGKEQVPVQILIESAQLFNSEATPGQGTAFGDIVLDEQEYQIIMTRDIWKDSDSAPLITPFAGYYTALLPGNDEYGSGYLSISVNAKGSVKVAGRLGDGTSVSQSGTLVSQNTTSARTHLFTAPRAYKAGFFSGTITLVDTVPGSAALIHLFSDFVWFNNDAQANENYGAGFLRRGNISGGWYDRDSLIETLDMELLHLSVGDLPDLPAKWKVTDWDAEGKRRITVTESGFIPAVTDATPDYLLLLPIIKKEIITGLTAPPKDAPVKQQDGTWDYTVDRNGDGFVNSAVLTFKVNPKTGVFTGKFTLWYDYISAYDFTKDTQKLAHTSKAVSFQGVMVPNSFGGTGSIRGGGYFLWPEQGEYDTGKLDRNGNPVMRSYKYKCSHLFEIVNPN